MSIDHRFECRLLVVVNGITFFVKAGAKTYFFDIKETREGKGYLLITESRFKGEGEDRERVTISVFPENIIKFSQAVSGMAAKLKQDWL